jgi:uncharacterized membrane protein YfcA
MSAVLVGFIIATTIGLTGVGGGTIATPLLIIVLRMKGAVAVGTALTFAAIIKLLVVPIYVARKQVSYKTLLWMVIGGLPGVLIGGRLLVSVSKSVDQHMLYLILGITILVAAILNVIRLVRMKGMSGTGNRPRWLAPLGSLALLGLTNLEASQVVGTDLAFGLILSVVGSGIQIVAGNFNGLVLEQLLLGGVLGALVGALLANKIPSRPLKWALAVWLACLGFQLFYRGIT